ncbi:NADH:flavin oxidoreductase/NADH oxidase [Ornithinimicrobium cerasi]|uniref:2,4-dienoyl-CoA reductase n=1 Tax=Ornithinimicrobium cerasi TaxID=2248773 RepID=A0A285VUS1_9MICO|nr:NADH:flavin oxidoreductase/NADH oxidase [Ornithinimicrobium cerasi]SOC57799.1 2,4-dienoyl-CoA reductase [Ornithinimicrobium cerasi]
MPPMIFSPLTLRSLEVPGRAWVSPMCQYSCRPSEPGFVTDWHLAHLMSFAVGGAPLILTEATAVSRDGRISPWDAGLWEDQQMRGWQRIVEQVHQVGALIGVQLAHAGRKGSTYAPFHERSGSVPRDDGGWQAVGAGERAFGSYAAPRGLRTEEVPEIVHAFARSAARAVRVGFDVVEVHAAHGYLLHQFLSPLVNDRSDRYGGDDVGRARLVLEVVDAVRAAIPDRVPLLVRVSATDWSDEVEGGIEGDVARTEQLCRELGRRGVDLIDVSSGGNVPAPTIPIGPGYQTRFAERVREAVEVPVSTVGMITGARQAEDVLRAGKADAVMLARAALADPHWWHRAAHQLGHALPWPPQYARVTDRHVF